VDLLVEAPDRRWLLKDLANLVAQEDVHVLDINSSRTAGAHSRGGQVRLRLRLRIADYGQLSRLLGKLAGVPGIERVRRA
jgi:GTP pyrophosphokinase